MGQKLLIFRTKMVWAPLLRGVYGKPGTPEQPGSAGTDNFLQLGSRASSNNTNYQTR